MKSGLVLLSVLVILATASAKTNHALKQAKHMFSDRNSFVSNCSVHYSWGFKTGCEKCQSGYFQRTDYFSLNKYICERCSSDCTFCHNSNACVTCSEGFYLQEGRCLKCSDGCATCVDGIRCQKCKAQYYLKNDVCATCTAGCDLCNNSQSCVNCSKAFFKSEGEKCTACIPGCDRCENATACQECHHHWNLIDGKCQEKTWLAKYWWVLLLIFGTVAFIAFCCVCLVKKSKNRSFEGELPLNYNPGNGNNWNDANRGWNGTDEGWAPSNYK